VPDVALCIGNGRSVNARLIRARRARATSRKHPAFARAGCAGARALWLCGKDVSLKYIFVVEVQYAPEQMRPGRRDLHEDIISTCTGLRCPNSEHKSRKVSNIEQASAATRP
jgi:hypothetical protein